MWALSKTLQAQCHGPEFRKETMGVELGREASKSKKLQRKQKRKIYPVGWGLCSFLFSQMEEEGNGAVLGIKKRRWAQTWD